MPLTRLDNLISSKTGKYLYVSPDDFNATDALSNRGNSPITPFKSIQRAFLEIARYSYLPGPDNDRFDQFSIMLMPGIHYIDNRPGLGDTANIDVFGFDQATNAWTDDSILDISNPDNIFWKFNNTEGGAIIPRGSSLVGYDLRRTVVRPMYVPDPASVTVPRSAIFNVTGGCYFWQFTIKDGQTTSESPLYNSAAGTGEVYYDPNDFTKKAAPNYSHHKLTVFEYADTEELSLFYRKIAKAFAGYQPTIDDPGEFDFNIQENRIVGPLSDSRVIESLKLTDATTDPTIPASTAEVEVTTKVDHGYFAGQFVSISKTEIDDVLEGFFPIKEIDPNDPRKFTYEVPIVVSAIGQNLVSGQLISQLTTPALGQNAQTLAEVDSVESASPYVFNCSIRSTWGICGIWANGLKATGFKSMVIAQYTGVSLQKDDRAFIRYDEYSNTWNQASLVDAFATVPYHAKGDSYWKDEWRNFHVRASEDAFIQNVSIFAVGFADHFLMESGGDMSITNSNSNFGNTSLHAIGFKGFSFNQDKAGYITDIIPPQAVEENTDTVEKINYYTVDITGTTQNASNYTKLFLGSDDIITPADRPAVAISGYRLGAKTDDKLYVKLDPIQSGGSQLFNVTLNPTGYVKYIAKGSILNPSGLAIDNVSADAANLIESNRRMIQEEVFGYIIEKYPRLRNISYVNPGLNPNANRYFDGRDLIIANRQEIIDTAYASTVVTYPATTINKVDIGEIVDAVAEDLRDGGNANTIGKVKEYFNGAGTLASFVGQEDEILWAFNRSRDLCKKAIANLLQVKADIYDPNPNSDLAPYGVGVGYTGSEAEEAGLTDNGVTVDAANTQDPAGRNKDGRNRIVANREFILDAALAEIAVYHPDFYIPGDTQSNEQSRYADGFRLIRRNSKEIADKALAAIALNHPDFYFPGDQQTDTGSRFADAYRLIQLNKDEIVLSAFNYMNANNPPSPLPANYETKCKRDIGYFIDAISLDVFLGSNEYAYRFAAEYFDVNGDPISNGLVDEESSSSVAFTQAAAQMKLAVANQLTVTDLTITADPLTGSNTDPASCANVQSAIDTLTTIVNTIIIDGNLSSVPIELNKGTLVNGELKCYRDINYFIDAISVDMFVGGNKHTRTYVQQYFSDSNTQLPNGLLGEEAESVTAFDAASIEMQKAVTNGLYYKDLTVTPGESEYGDGNGVVGNTDSTACSDVQSAISNLVSIVTDVFQGQPTPSLDSLPAENEGTLLAGETKCRRDIGHIVDAVAQDLWFGGNEFTIAATKEYFDANDGTVLISNGVDNEVAPSITAFRRAQDLMNRAVNNQYYDRDLTITLDQTGDPPVFSDIHSNAAISITDNKKFIAAEAYERMLAAYPSYTPQTGNTKQDCLDDVYDVLDQIAYNVKFGGNDKTYDAAEVYVTNIFEGQVVETFIDAERDEAAKVFLEAKNIAIQVINNETVSVSAGHTETQVFDFTQTDDWDDDDAPLPQCGSAVAATDTLFGIIIQAIGTDAGVGNLNGITRTATPQPTAYAIGNCSDVLATIDTLVSIVVDTLYAGDLDVLPIIDSGEWDCANVRSTIESLYDIASDAILGNTLGELPVLNQGDFTLNNEASKCFRDVTYIVDGIVNDLRLGGNIACVQAAEAYFVGNQLDYIDGEKTETLDAWDYVGQMATAAMRNFDFLAFNCSTTIGSAIVDVGDTRGILIGMSVVEYLSTDYVDGLLQPGATAVYSNIPEGTYVKKIVSNTQIELGVLGSRLDTGDTQNALQNSTTTDLYFTFEKGTWADTLPKTVVVGPASSNPDVIQDTTTAPGSVECAGVTNAIETLTNAITTIINTGVGSVTRQEPTVNSVTLAARATVFTIDTSGVGTSNPHDFETGTAVRLVPRPRFDEVTGKYVDVDKRLVRLPNGFETNRTYYVIAPGRRTQPEDYSNTTFFNGSDQTKLMLATSKENAAAGIYIYASETEGIDPNVEIDIYQFLTDDSYDLHKYGCNLTNTVNAGIETDVSNIFDVPFASVTPQKVFFRAVTGGTLPAVSTTFENDSDVAVTDPNDANLGKINPVKEFFARYQNNKVFTIHKTHADAINNVNPIQFGSGQTSIEFEVYANKRRSPVRFDPGFTDTATTSGKWFIQCKDEVSSQPDSIKQSNIFWRIHQSDYADRPKTTDMWFERVKDDRDKDERTYKIRYVIPKYLENARDPINGFVLKTRTDDTRKLVPQKLLLKPVTGSVYGARFSNPVQADEYIGYTRQDFADNNLNLDAAYDPYKKDLTGSGINYIQYAKFASGIQASIQSGRYVEDTLDPTIKYLELTVFDHAVDAINFPGLRNEVFTTVKITAPQGGDFTVSKTQSVAANEVAFTGNSSGLANIHAYYSVGGDHYLIIKNIRGGKLEYSEYYDTRFTQGSVFADMLEDQDMGKSLPLKTLIRKNYPEYYYKQNGANVYTITPGDRIQDSAGVEYYVDSVEDAGVIEDTFYIFGYETLQRRIAGQQDGIYYLTALRGNVSPFPTGAGVADNFKKFKFSQPVSRLYPLNYKNDPLWFKKNGTSNKEKAYYELLIDPPSTFSAADNYIHGLVTTNDYKNSVTKELVEDLFDQPAFINNEYTNTTSDGNGNVIDNRVRAQEGNATSGSEDRRIPIAGDSTVMSDQRYYVELRRPSIARAGNHTFEYLGFGPGNYSTGLPARQEIVLTPEEDFYAQSKKQDAGIVFYTGINSQGDLYIGNRRINAITGEETFIDAAILEDDGDDEDVVGGLVTTFDTPVTFNQNITVVGGDGQLVNTFESPILIAVQDEDLSQERHSLIIRSYVSSIDPVTFEQQDESLDRTGWLPDPSRGDIRIGKNRIQSAIFGFNSRGQGQEYKFLTHTIGGVPSNLSPNQSPMVPADPNASVEGSRVFPEQLVNYNGVIPRSGDVLFKGSEVGSTGSMGWILSNYFTTIANTSIGNIIFDDTNVVKITFVDFASGLDITCSQLGITSASQIRFKNFYPEPSINLTWTIYSPPGDAFSGNNNYLHFQAIDAVGAQTLVWDTVVSGATGDAPTVEFSNSNWKELGVIGAEAIRTETEYWGDFKVGVNTIARTPWESAKTAWTDPLFTEPRANFDVVGNTFISGKKVLNFLKEGLQFRTLTNQDHALLVGGDSESPEDIAAFRISTTPGPIGQGRMSVNATLGQLNAIGTDHVIIGSTNITGNLQINGGLEIFVGDFDTTSGTLDMMETPETIRFIMNASNIQFANESTNTETMSFDFGNYAQTQTLTFGDQSEVTTLNIHRNSQDSTIDIGTVSNLNDSYSSTITIGGAFSSSSSQLTIQNKNISLDGDVEVGSGYTAGSGTGRLFSLNSRFEFLTASGGPSTVRLATTASTLDIGGVGGTTTINNALYVKARADFDGDIQQNGGLNAGGVNIIRGVFGTPAAGQPAGGLPDNFNLDLYKKIDIGGKTLDTQGVANMPASEEFIRLSSNSVGQILLGDYLLIASGSDAQETASELVRVIELTNLSDVTDPEGIRVKVERGVDGTTAGVHADNTPIFRIEKSENVSYSKEELTNVDTQLETAEFGGSLRAGDYIRINDSEFLKIDSLITSLTSTQKFTINDGGDPAVITFQVESTTGNTFIRGTCDIFDTTTIHGSTAPGDQKLIITNGDTVPTVVFDVDSAQGNTKILGDLSVGAGFDKFLVEDDTGNTTIKGGNFIIRDTADTNNRLHFSNNLGKLEIAGEYLSNGLGENTFAGDLVLNGGNLTVNSNGTKIFKVQDNGTVDLGGIEYFYGPTGARRWDYVTIAGGDGGVLTPNINYFTNATGDLYLKLPANPSNGDMVRIIDLGGNLKYDLKLIIRASTGTPIQGDATNIAADVIGVDLSQHNGGELVVTTPNAAFGLVYAGPINNDGGASNVPSTAVGWWLMEI